MNNTSQDLARVQSESRISINTWREWCTRLGMDQDDAVEVWDEICSPMALVARTLPDVAYILQLRNSRLELDIEDFKEEIPAVLHFNSFVGALQDGPAIGEKSRSAVIRYFQASSAAQAGGPRQNFVRSLLSNLCTGLLVAKLLPAGKVNLSRLLGVLVEGKGSLDNFLALAVKSSIERPFAEEVTAFVRSRAALIALASTPLASESDIEDDEDEVVSDDDGEAVDSEAADDDEHEEDDDEEDTVVVRQDLDASDEFFEAFRSLLETIYDEEAAEDTALPEQVAAARQRAISAFDPLRARIPSLEEARSVSQQSAAGGAGRERALRPQARSGGGAKAKSGPNPLLASSGGKSSAAGAESSGGMAASPAAKSGATSPLGEAKPEAAKIERPQTAGETDVSKPVAPGSPGVELPATVSDDDEVIDVPRIVKTDLSMRVNLIGQLLGGIEQQDPRVWNLYAEPTADVDELCDLAEALLTEESGTERAYAALRVVAQQQQFKSLLSLPPEKRLKEKRFDLEAAAFINTVSSSRRSFESDSRQLVPLPKVLDHAAASLVRLEALRSSVKLARTSPEEFSAEAATELYESVLSNVTYQADREIIEAVRQKADADIRALVELLEGEARIEHIVACCEEYLDKLEEGDHTANAEALAAVFGSQPLQFEGVDPSNGRGSPPEQFTAESGLGEIVDATREYVSAKVWQVLDPERQPEEVMQRVEELIRKRLSHRAKLPVRKERHEKNPKVALSVVSVEKLTGNAELSHLFVRLSVEGSLLFVEDFESGEYIDLFELRKNERKQMHAQARRRAASSDSGELQAGAKYLHSLGRTSKPFGSSLAEVMSACILTDEGEPRLYPIF